MLYSETCEGIICHLWQWQSLIVGLLALGAAIATVCVMRRQIAQNEVARAEDFSRKSKSYRARMNPVLSNLCAHNIDCFGALISEEDEKTLPMEPQEEIGLIGSAIEYADNESAEAMSKMISQYQVHRSRLREFLAKDRYNPEDNWSSEMLYNAVLLHHQITNMFEYARRQNESISPDKPSRATMTNALTNMMGLKEFLEHRQKVAGGIELIEQRHPD